MLNLSLMLNTKHSILASLIIGVIFSPGVTFAHGDDAEEAAASTGILQQILTHQEIETVQQLDCDKVTEHEWEELGDAVMGEVHPNPTQHSMMDNMMGGEGSESLTQAHIQMGKNYLGCTSTKTGVMNMMSSGMMNNWGLGSMMNGGWGSGYGVLSAIFWIAGIAALVAITRYFWKKG